MNYLLSALIGYFLGSIPTGYLILKYFKGIDIREKGTGDVGAMNSYEVSQSKFLEIIIFLIDALKGLLSVYIVLLLLPLDFIFPGLALLFAILSHCFNPWIKFKGGRGLATAAGGLILLFPYLLAVWITLWVIFYLMKKDVIFSNVSATIMSLILIFSTVKIASKYTFPQSESEAMVILFSTSVLIIIFIKHIEPLKEIFKNSKILIKDNHDEKN